jgi:diguanylate cyclase (GGDEF)-like protein
LTALRDRAGGLSGFAFVSRDVSDRKQIEDELAVLALHDHLTGLPNRALFLEQLASGLARARRHRSQLALLFVDLDEFKAVNDRLGHAAGDQLLIAAAERLGAAVRDNDLVARFGGDEFTVLCEDLHADQQATAIAQRILTALQQPLTVEGSTLSVPASIGIALAAGVSETAAALLHKADAAMYQAKHGGGGRVALAADQPGGRAIARAPRRPKHQ